MIIIDSLYGLLSPSRKETALRDKKVAACKKRMGDIWLLAKAMPRLPACTGNCNQGRTCRCRK